MTKFPGIPDDPFRYPAKLSGIPDALIFFSHPFLVSRQEKDVGVRGQRPPPSILYAPNGKNLALPIVLNPPLSGRFVGRIQYAPTLTDENRASNKHVFAPFGSFVGRIQYAPTLTAENGVSNKHESAPSGRFVGRIQYAPTGGQQKTENEQQKMPGTW